MKSINDIHSTCGSCFFFNEDDSCCMALGLDTRVNPRDKAAYCLTYEPRDRADEWCSLSDVDYMTEL